MKGNPQLKNRASAYVGTGTSAVEPLYSMSKIPHYFLSCNHIRAGIETTSINQPDQEVHLKIISPDGGGAMNKASGGGEEIRRNRQAIEDFLFKALSTLSGSYGVDVSLTFSSMGGTGSGTACDLVDMIEKLTEYAGLGKPMIFCICGLPAYNSSLHDFNFRVQAVNAYALLSRLSFLLFKGNI